MNDDLTPEFYTTERLNTEPPAEQRIELPAPLKGLEGGIPRGQMVVLGSKTRHDAPALWADTLRRIAASGMRVLIPLEDLPSSKCEILKGRPADKLERFAVDYSSGACAFAPVEITPIDWEPPRIQAESRLRRSLTGSRNQREGVYALKVNGRHTRKRRDPEIEILPLDSAGITKIQGLADANVDRKQRIES